MAKLKQYSSVFLFMILLVSIVYGYMWFRSRSTVNYDTRIAIPAQAPAFIEFNNLPALIHEIDTGNNIWAEFQKLSQLNSFKIRLHSFDSALNRNPQLSDFFSKKLTVVLCPKSNKTYGLLFIIPVSSGMKQDIILDLFKKYNINSEYTKRRFESYNIYDLDWSDNGAKKSFTFSIIKGLVIGSFSGELVEESINQIRSGYNLAGQAEFKEVDRTIGEKVPANLFISYRNLPGFVDHLSAGKGILRSSKMTDFADWGAFDAEIFSDRIILNGFTSLNDTVFSELSIFDAQEPIEFASPSFLPSFVNLFKLYGFSDTEKFFKQITKKFELDGSLKKISSFKSSLTSTYEIDLDKSIKELINNEYGMAFLTEGKVNHKYFFIKLKSQSIAEEVFTGWIKIYAQRNGLNINDFMFNARIDNNTSIPVYNLPVGGIPSMVFGDEFVSVDKDYFTFINNYIVFSNSFGALKYFIYQVILGNTVSMDPTYSTLNEHISSLSNYFIFIRPYSFLEQAAPLLNEKIRETIKTSKERISKLNALSLQYSAADNLLYNRIFINYSGQINENVKTVWESRLDTIINFKPAIMLNHNTGEKEIFIQDSSNQIYLLSNAGLILWKQRIEGPILSEVIQVDYFGNKKLQYLFNTANRIYLMDRNGNPVEKFPVNLRSKATSGMSVFDYDKDGSIRICIPCEDRNIYMYDKDGRIIPGWKPRKTDTEVNHPLQHFRIGNRDYIIAIDKYKFYILDRRGNTRLRPAKSFPVSINNIFYLDNTNKAGTAGLITTDTSGNIMKVNLNGKVEKILEQNLDPDHFFVLADLNGDKVNEYIFTSENEFFVLNPRGKKLFSNELSAKIDIKPLIYQFSASDNRIGIVLNKEGIICLYNSDGTLYKGFPLDGIGPFSISSFPEFKGQFNLIVGGKNNFLYNYFVQ